MSIEQDRRRAEQRRIELEQRQHQLELQQRVYEYQLQQQQQMKQQQSTILAAQCEHSTSLPAAVDKVHYNMHNCASILIAIFQVYLGLPPQYFYQAPRPTQPGHPSLGRQNENW